MTLIDAVFGFVLWLIAGLLVAVAFGQWARHQRGE
jgi:hypothetical protein